jgi:hypothetical protein
MVRQAPASSASRVVPIVLAVVGLVLLIVGLIYFAVPNGSLPGFLPHRASGAGSGHAVKRGGVAVVLAIVCFAGAWLATRRTGRASAS